MNNHYKIIYALLSFNIYASCYINIENLHTLTNLSHDSIKHWMNEFQAIESWNEATADYYPVFPNLINRFNLKKGCELGVSTGGQSYAILEKTNVEKLYSIDHYSPNYWIDFNSKGVLDLYFLRIKARLGQFGERSEMVRMFSLEAVDLFKNNELDFIFIDADHTYEAVKQDLELWYKKIRSGGIIGGDDYATIWPGVRQAVDEFFISLGLIVNQDQNQPRIWWVQKP